MEILGINKQNDIKKNHRVVLYLQLRCKMDNYIIKCTHCTHGYSQPCLILLANCTSIMYDNYITTRVNVRPNQWLLCN